VLLGAEPELYMGGRSTPLGIPTPASPRIEATFNVAPGGGFALYTDGLIERRGESLDVGLDRLLDAIRERPNADPDDLVEALVDPSAGDDDVCILVFRYHGTVPSSST
jgi:serine phosphatase RsbU (regulator of sigma subunit)